MAEAALANKRINSRIADDAALLQIAVASVLNEKAGKEFTKAIKSLKS